MNKNLIFLPLVKVDEVERTVTGQITAEVLDKSGETFHYDTSVPYFKAWSDSFDAVTKGKSKGNLRVMHQPSAVGKFTNLEFDDATKTITGTAKVVDDDEWQKVLEGVYTGFSIGGKYIKRWAEKGVNFFTADPAEVSLVDNPCVPTATFTAVKADGVEELRKFQLYEPSNEELATKATELAKGGNWIEFLDEAREELKKAHGLPEESEEDDTATAEEETDDIAKGADPAGTEPGDALEQVEQVWKATDGKTFSKKADCVAHQETISDPVAAAMAKANRAINGEPEPEPADAEIDTKPYGDAVCADPGLNKSGVHCLPIDNEANVRASWVFAHQLSADRYENGEEAVKSIRDTINKAYTEVVGRDAPSDEAFELLKSGELTKALQDDELKKSLITVEFLADAVGRLCWVVEDVNYCFSDTMLPESGKMILAQVLAYFLEVAETAVDRKLDVMGIKEAFAPADMSKAAGVSSDELKKLQDDNAKLQKQVSDAVDGIATLTSEIEKLKKEPEPRPLKGVVVEKSGDRNASATISNASTSGDLAEVLKNHTPEEISLALIKHSQQNPQKMGAA